MILHWAQIYIFTIAIIGITVTLTKSSYEDLSKTLFYVLFPALNLWVLYMGGFFG